MVKPIGTNAQAQRMVVTLKNICRDYPAGGGVLRELLQNADDAGASIVRFVLDERQYPTEPLIDQHLARYQGPALLAYNSAEFTDKDFSNLKRTGDSYKLDDGSTTGRFGRGFNSVYNWTDSPSIVSRNRLLILDPHEWWSRPVGVSPVYDFVASCEDEEVRNQMQAYTSIMDDLKHPLAGTIIRIPLRTKQQATVSEIMENEVTVEEVRKVLADFAMEFGDSGLLFMRNIETLRVETTSGMNTTIHMVNKSTLRSTRLLIKDALKAASSQENAQAFSHCLDIQIERSTMDERVNTTYAVQHQINARPGNRELSTWMQKQKINPWVAIAAPLQPASDFTGSLFAVLPLPILSAQSIHIHSMFSISPDRARLYLDDKNVSDNRPAEWNHFLFNTCVPKAWANLLSSIATIHPSLSTFDYWPRVTEDHRDPLRKASDLILEEIESQKLPVFPTVIGYLRSERAILDTGKESTNLKAALDEAQIPMVYAPDEVRAKLKVMFSQRRLCPMSVFDIIRNKNELIRTWSVNTKQKILEYLTTAEKKIDYESMDLLPFEDGTYRAISQYQAFMHRDDLEKSLFSLESSHNIDLTSLTPRTKSAFESVCAKALPQSNLQYRKIQHFAYFCRTHIFSEVDYTDDFITISVNEALFKQVWKWIAKYAKSITADELSDLWLIPLTDGRYRKLKPTQANSLVMVTNKGEMGEIIRQIDANKLSNAPVLVDLSKTGLEKPSYLFSDPNISDELQLLNSSRPVHLAQWLKTSSDLVANLSDSQKQSIMKHFATVLKPKIPKTEIEIISSAIQSLQIFKRVRCQEFNGKSIIISTWTSINNFAVSYGDIDGLTAILDVADHQILDTKLQSDAKLVIDTLRLIQCHNTEEMIRHFLLPRFTESTSTLTVKVEVAGLMLDNYSRLASNSRLELSGLPIVPVSKICGTNSAKLLAPKDLIDPMSKSLINMHFEDDEVLPQREFYDKYSAALILCGLKTNVDDELVQRLSLYYAKSNRSMIEIQHRAHHLLESQYSPRFGQASNFRGLKWIPVSVSGTMQRMSARSCRGQEDHLLAGLVLPIVEVATSAAWKTVLGWDTPVSEAVLMEQLQQSLILKSSSIVDAVFPHIKSYSLLKDVQFVLTTRGEFLAPAKSFRSGCIGLSPYLGNVDTAFYGRHEAILRLCGVADKPSLDDLLEVQRLLEGKCPLEDRGDITVAVTLADRFTQYDHKSRANVKLFANDGNFYPAIDLVYPNIGKILDTDRKVTHSKLTQEVAQCLGVDLWSVQQVKLLLDIDDKDDDDDEFDQREQVTTRIRDTLDRYPITATFTEYLANADDAGATKISWLLDNRRHSLEGLLTPELQCVQNAALLVHNDSVFTETDIKGFKNVGEGSKKQDIGTIGQFGRGSQTMFHWTDVPMILSGKFLIILDPQQQVLQINQKRGQRKPGVKLSLEKLRAACPGHLEAFDKLFGYSVQLDYYPGTIFRFPLRSESTVSKLQDASNFVDDSQARQKLSAYFDEARVSLLFLKNIRSINFGMQGAAEPEWSVSRISQQGSMLDHPRIESGNGGSTTIESVVCDFNCNTVNGNIGGKDMWRLARSDVIAPSEELLLQQRRVIKNVECGIAGLLSSEPNQETSKAFFGKRPVNAPRIFSTLPLPFESNLPVAIHATFSLSGDRRSLIVGGQGGSPQAAWNNHFLKDALPELYLSFIDDIASNFPQHAFRFWPRIVPSGSCVQELFASFKAKLPSCPRRLYLKAQNQEQKENGVKRETLTFKQAVFSLNSKYDSNKLVPLFLSVGIPLVNELPSAISTHLSRGEEAARITESYLRQVFTTAESKNLLQAVLSTDPSIFHELLKMTLESKSNPEELHNTCFLRLQNDELGTLRVRTIEKKQEFEFFIATLEEAKLFDFANDVLVSRADWEAIANVTSPEFFTVTNLKLSHLPLLFKKKRKVDKVDRKWLGRFWNYWTSHISAQTKHKGVEKIVRLSVLQAQAAVIEPTESAHRSLCEKFPDLWRFDSAFVTSDLRVEEESFSNPDSFYRFIKALRRLCTIKQTFGSFVATNLNSDDLKEFRRLVILQTSIAKDSNGVFSLAFNEAKPFLASIPLWESCDSSSGALLPANELLIISKANTDDLLVPWLKDYRRFVRDRTYLQTVTVLGATVIEPLSVVQRHVFPLPPIAVGTSDWTAYQNLVSWLHNMWSNDNSHAFRSFLSQQAFAIDQAASYRAVRGLFDHHDSLFIAAFRKESDTRFLHSIIRKYRNMWLSLGLQQRQNTVLVASTYIECLGALESRLSAQSLSNDAHFVSDCTEVLSPLVSSNSRISNFNQTDWNKIGNIPIFKTQTNTNAESQYRRDAMSEVAAGQQYLTLSNIVSRKFAPSCWSQVPFPLSQPTKEVMSHFKSGKPSTLTVWRHLLQLKDITQYLRANQVKDFLTDLQETYKFLQENDIKDISQWDRQKSVWLNLASFDGNAVLFSDVKSQWVAAENLVLSSSCDAGPKKAVKAGLMRFENLLREMGSSSVTYPTVERPTAHESHSIAGALRSLRDQGKLLDVHYHSENQVVKAHRLVLAAISEVCVRQFSTTWSQNVTKDDEGAMQFFYEKFDSDGNLDEAFLSHHTLETMINYAYDSQVNWEGMLVDSADDSDSKQAKLDKLLDLLHGSDFWIIPALKSEVEAKILDAGKELITIANVRDALNKAQRFNAHAVEEYCKIFIEVNKAVIYGASSEQDSEKASDMEA